MQEANKKEFQTNLYGLTAMGKKTGGLSIWGNCNLRCTLEQDNTTWLYLLASKSNFLDLFEQVTVECVLPYLYIPLKI